MNKRTTANRAAPFILFALIAGFAVGLFFRSEPKVIYVEESGISDVISAVSPAVVGIVSKNSPARGGGSAGSGFIVSGKGLVVTNRHVVDDPEAEYSVVLGDGRAFSVSGITADEIYDLAVLKLTDADGNAPANLPVAKLGNSDEIEVGQRVVAIGISPVSNKNTVSDGIISATGLVITAGGFSGSETLTDLIQTDVAINAGDSGDPLVNLHGEVIGICTALDTTNGRISFAIPVNAVARLLAKTN
ncbi:S1C family serine protease [Patescibacteria group bacterium]|nr:S1C family serine protease [Patescibacteria group bacterium]MBU1016361.1 S1C family serine protease [Patescibacteria group bacterium]MBU1684655.1 S1C family serine protease [Patescibacteria group bacterium]MBU1938431.1 S1C family serine protease [Patescibacteria group bacterium]